MRLGYFHNGHFPPIEFEEFAKWGAENGFQAIDVPLFQADAAVVCDRYGLMPSSTTGQSFQPITADAGIRRAEIDKGRRAVDYAASQGIATVQIGHHMATDAGFDENISLFSEGCSPVADYAEAKGVSLVLENWPNHGRNLAYWPAHWEAIFDAVQSDSLGLCLDPSHLVWLGIDYVRATLEFGDRIFHVHAKDTELMDGALYDHGVIGDERGMVGQGTYRFRIPGFGEIDWPRFISALVEAGYDDVLAVEHEDPLWTSKTDAEHALKGLMLAQKFLSPLIV